MTRDVHLIMLQHPVSKMAVCVPSVTIDFKELSGGKVSGVENGKSALTYPSKFSRGMMSHDENFWPKGEPLLSPQHQNLTASTQPNTIVQHCEHG